MPQIVIPGPVIDGPIAYREYDIDPSGCVGVCPADVLHRHLYPHTIRCRRGKIKVAVKGDLPQFVILEPNQTFVVEAGLDHLIQAIDGPAVFRCEFFHRDKDGNIIPIYDVNTCTDDAYEFDLTDRPTAGILLPLLSRQIN